MHSIVSLTTADGTLRRYERAAGNSARLTHELALPKGDWRSGVEWQAGSMESFRIDPPEGTSIRCQPCGPVVGGVDFTPSDSPPHAA